MPGIRAVLLALSGSMQGAWPTSRKSRDRRFEPYLVAGG